MTRNDIKYTIMQQYESEDLSIRLRMSTNDNQILCIWDKSAQDNWGRLRIEA